MFLLELGVSRRDVAWALRRRGVAWSLRSRWELEFLIPQFEGHWIHPTLEPLSWRLDSGNTHPGYRPATNFPAVFVEPLRSLRRLFQK